MKRFLPILLVVLLIPLFGFDWDWNEMQRFLNKSHNWGGTQTFDSVDINDGTLDDVDIGAAVQGTGEFTSLTSTSLTVNVNKFIVDSAGVTVSSLSVPNLVASLIRSGASPVNTVPTSGTSLTGSELGTIITHNQSTSTIYGLPLISGASVVYVKIIEGAGGSGITIYTSGTTNVPNGEPFMGDGLSGTSYLALPPGCPFESATVYSVQLSGTCKYWFVEASSSWEAGD